MKTTTIQHIAAAFLAFVFTAASASAALNLVTAKTIIDNSLARTSSDGGVTWTDTPTFPDSGSNIWLTSTRDNLVDGNAITTVSDTSTAPVMRITLATGLNANQNYTVHAYFYDANTATWDIALGSDGTNLTNYNQNSSTRLSTLSQAERDAKWDNGYDGITGIANATNDWFLHETNAVIMQTDDNGVLYTYVGRGTATGRSVFQGLAYEFHSVPEPATYALIFGALSFGFVMLRRRFKA